MVNYIVFMALHHLLLLLAAFSTLATPWCLRSALNVTQTVSTIDFSPDGTLLAVTLPNINTVYIYDTNNYIVQQTYIPSGATARAARFSRNGLYLVVGLSNGNVNIIPGRSPFSNTSSFSYTVRSGNSVFDIATSAGNDKLLVCFSTTPTFTVVSSYLTAAPTVLNNQTLASSSGGCKFSNADDVAIIDNGNAYVYSWPLTATWKSKVTTSVAYTDLSVRNKAGTIKVIVSGGGSSGNNAYYFSNSGTNSVVTATAVPFINNPVSSISSACYSGDGSSYAFASTDFKMWVFDDTSNNQAAFLTDASLPFTCCAFNQDGSVLVGGTSKAGSTSYVYIYTKACLFCDTGSYLNSGACASCTTVLVGCAMCINNSTCTACFQGYYLLVNNTCGTCSGTLAGCSTCVNSSYCIQCNNGFYLNGGNTCTTCNPAYVGCIACNLTACLLCDMDYQLSGTSCVKCTTPGCLRCNSSGSCVECQNGLYANAGSCSACGTGCLTCYSSTNCSNCIRGYVLSGTACNPCPSNCLECNSTACLDCNLGTFASGTGCTACTAPCFTCSVAANNCTSCITGYFISGNICDTCTNNCSVCNSSSYCFACSVGYYLTSSSTCLSCASQYTGCTQCTLGACTACDQTRYLANPTNCSVCNAAMPGCQVCSSDTVCTLCAVGYYSSGTACTICPSQCEICSAINVCSSCAVGFWLNVSTCTTCSSPCATCTTDTACLSCVVNYYISGTTCSPCTNLANCLDCLSNTYCIMCLQGYYPNAGTCTACPTNCLQCNSTNCFSCNLGYYISGLNSCAACSANCSLCSTSSVCQSCNVGYYLNTNVCTSCTTLSVACLTCNGSSNCLSCANGYFLTTGYVCATCQSAITYCTFCSSNTVCTQCQDGYYLALANSCLSCNTLTGCLDCTASNTCTLCASGYYLNAGTCNVCPSNCSACTSSTSCTACNPQFYLSSTTCLACQDSLIGCQSCSSNAVCLSCGGGYLLAGSTCSPCSSTLPACSLCSTAGVCQSCQQGYYLDSTLFTCKLCSSSATLSNCLLCNSSTICQYCQSGYYLASNVCNLCSSVLSNCQQCSSPTTCLDCASGYYLATPSNTCVVCQSAIPGCIFCSSSTTCTQCHSGYYLSGITCSPCSQAGCQICDPVTPTNCITCSSGYYMSGSSCIACSQTGCLNCNSTACTLCQSGYYLSAGSCTLCSSSSAGCSKCTSAGVCSECQSLFYLSGTSCLGCSSAMVGCTFCTSSTNCLACDGGYYLSGGICNPCSNIAGCLICNSSTSCLTCTAGYYLSANTCLSCSVAITNCYQCYTATTCASCANGYELSTSGGCQAMKVSSGSSAPAAMPASLKFKTYYVDDNTLKHALSVSDGSKFQNIAAIDWVTVTKIYLQNTSTSTLLTVKTVQLSADKTILYFYTNNIIAVKPVRIPTVSSGRILVGQSMESLQLASSLSLPQTAINTVLPSLLITSDLQMSYHLDASEFYTSYVLKNFTLNFYLFGIVIVSLLFLYGLVRSICYPLFGRNIQIAGHLLALKTMPLVVYPTYAQYVNFSLGFMSADLPWVTKMLPNSFFSTLDTMPMGYLFYFFNMNFASMQILSSSVFVLLLILGYCIFSQPKVDQVALKEKDQIVPNYKFKSFKQFLCNFFSFGLIFAGFSSIVGAFLNQSNILSLNGIFYIVGVVAFGVGLSEAFANLVIEKRISRVRVALKATFLAAAGLNPLYLAATAILVDAILIIVQYCMRKTTLACPITWLISNIVALLSLTVYYFIPDSLLTIYIVMGLVCLVVVLQIYQFCNEKCLDESSQHKFYEAYAVQKEGHFWNLAPQNVSQIQENQKEANNPLNEKQDKLIFNSFVQDEEENRDAATTSYSTKGFEPKRRTRKFKKESVAESRYMQANQSYTSSWTKNIPTKDLPDIMEEEP